MMDFFITNISAALTMFTSMQVITDMEKLKQDYHKRLTEAQYYLM